MRFLAAFFISYLFQLGIIWFSHKKKVFLDDQAKRQKVHKKAVPRIGGLGVFIASFAVMGDTLGQKLILASVPAFMAGFFEDLISNISPRVRLAIMLFSAVLGMHLMGNIVWDFEFAIMPWFIAIPFTLLMVVGITNALNIIDGLNGLASGFSIIVLTAFALTAYFLEDRELAAFFCFFIFPTLAFFVLNFPRAYIFLGDSGSYFLGFILVQCGIILINRHPEISSYFAFLVLFYPLWEVLFSMYRRKFLKSAPAMAPDKLHLHTLLYKRTLLANPAATALILFMIGLLCALGLMRVKETIIQVLLVFGFMTFYLYAYWSLVSFRTITKA